MHDEPTTAVIQRYLDALPEDPAAEPIIRELLERAVDRLRLLCATLLHRSYPRLTRPPMNLQTDELLGGVVAGLLTAMRTTRPPTVCRFFALANQHIRWQLNDLAHAHPGIVLAEAGRLDAAIDHYQTALNINPNLTGTHTNLGIALRARGRPDEAISHFREALRIDPRHAPAHNDLGLTLAGKGQLDEAISHFEQALKVSPQLAATHFNLGLALKKSGRLDQAIRSFQQAVRLAPRFAQAHGALGEALLTVGRFGEAQAATRRCLDLLPPGHPLRAGTTQQQQLCDYLLALESRLPAVLQGKDRPANATERLQFANICTFRKRYAATAQLRLEAFTATPQLADDLDAGHRYNAACTAALAGCGRGADASKLGQAERERWRKQARQWLAADLAAWTRKVESGPAATRALARRQLLHWRSDPDLVGLREPGALEAMSSDERKECVALWKVVAVVLGRAQASR